MLYFEKSKTYSTGEKRKWDDNMTYKAAICDDDQTDAGYVEELHYLEDIF